MLPEDAVEPPAPAPAPRTEQQLALQPLLISWPGYGILFFWQLGVLQHLQHAYAPLLASAEAVRMVGSSAGALLCVLAACNVSPQAALDRAHELCVQHGVYQRPLGLAGVWGGIVRQWLHELLPPNAAELCSGGHVSIVITCLPWFTRRTVSDFKDKEDLVSVVMASAHVPWLLDGRFATRCRGMACVDGSLLYMLTRRCAALKPVQQPAGAAAGPALLLFDPLHDSQLLRDWRQLLASVLACGKEGAQRLMSQGMQHAAALDEAGGLSLLRERLAAAAGGGGGGRDSGSVGSASGCCADAQCVVSLVATSAAGKQC